MDRVSAILIFCIAALIGLSGFLVYNTLDTGRDSISRIESVSEPAGETEELQFNRDTSITNNSERDLWIRAKIVFDTGCDESDFVITSSAVENGIWVKNGSWYYSSAPVYPQETTEPVIDELSRADDSGQKSSFKLKVEAVDEAWLTVKPESGVEAFDNFHKLITEQDGVQI